MKLDYGKTAILGFGFFGVSLIWSLYNSYVPVFLEKDFLLSATLVGVAWALININSLPMVVDIAPQNRIGTYTGLYYFFSTLAAIFGPWLGGALVDATGRDYTMIFTIAPIGMLVAFLCMLGVRRGERAETAA
jgi:MFS family permease